MKTLRREARVAAFQGLYMLEIGRSDLEAVLQLDWLEEDNPLTKDEALQFFARGLISGTHENQAEIDSLIVKHSPRWEIGRIGKVDLSLIRMSIFSLFFSAEKPPVKVVIDEAVEIAKEYSTDSSYRFVNGVLDGIVKAQSAV